MQSRDCCDICHWTSFYKTLAWHLKLYIINLACVHTLVYSYNVLPVLNQVQKEQSYKRLHTGYHWLALLIYQRNEYTVYNNISKCFAWKISTRDINVGNSDVYLSLKYLIGPKPVFWIDETLPNSVTSVYLLLLVKTMLVW